MQVTEINVANIKEYENNPRNNDAAVDSVSESIKQFGFKVPILIDSNNIIICGHTRIKAARKLGLDKVPCIVADDLTPEQIKAFRLADNKTCEIAEWNMELLEAELKELSNLELDFSMSDFGFEFEEESEPQEIIEDEAPEVDEDNEPLTKQGDIWQLGEHKLICGDSTSKETIKRLVGEAMADMVVTDPPYNINYQGGTGDKLTIQNDNMSDEEFNSFLTTAFECMNDALKEGGAFYIWYASREHINFETALNKADFQVRQQLIWAKSGLILSRQDYHWQHEPCLYGWKSGATHNWYSDRKQSTLLEFEKPTKNLEHPTMKPVELIAYLISNSSKKNDIVLDIFGGSGTTLIASEQLNRKCYMVEIDPKYCDVIIKRYENFTGQKAVRLETQKN